MKGENKITSGNPYKALIAFAIPFIISGLLQQMYAIADSIILGNFVGDAALGAVGVTAPITNIFTFAIMGITSGYIILLAHLHGGGKTESVTRLTSTTVILLSALAVLLVIPSLFLKDWVLAVINTPALLVKDAGDYLNISLCAVPAVLLYNMYSSMLRGVGDSKTPLRGIIISSILNVVLDLVFVPVLNWGVTGAAVATMIAQVVSALFLIIHTERHYPPLRVRLGKKYFDLQLFGQCVKLGVPKIIQSMSSTIGSMLLQNVKNGFGLAVVTGITTAYRVDTLTLLPIMNISTAMSIFVGQNLGAGNIERAKEGLRVGKQISLAISLVITALFVFFAEPLLGIFGISQEAVKIGARFLRICGVFYPVFAIFNAYLGYLHGAKDAVFAAFFQIVALAVRVALSYSLRGVIGSDIIAVAECAAWSVSFLACYLRYRHLSKLSFSHIT